MIKQVLSNYKVIFKYISIVALVGYFVYGYNRVPVLDESVIAKWAQVENQYQRRADLIPSLVAVVKAYAKHEQETLESVVKARASAIRIKLSVNDLNSPEMLQKFDAAQSSIASSLTRLMVLVESYPDLKADENFLVLQAQLEGTENRITVARMDYIQAINEYNTFVRTIPGVFFAKIHSAKVKANFSATVNNAHIAPKI